MGAAAVEVFCSLFGFGLGRIQRWYGRSLGLGIGLARWAPGQQA